MGAHTLFAVIFLVTLMFEEGLCLNCVQCNSFVNKTCDTDPKLHIQPCADVNATACRKMEQEVYYDGDYHVRTVRQCAVTSGPLNCFARTGTYRFKVFYCHCNENDCNSADNMSVSFILIALSAMVVYLVRL